MDRLIQDKFLISGPDSVIMGDTRVKIIKEGDQLYDLIFHELEMKLIELSSSIFESIAPEELELLKSPEELELSKPSWSKEFQLLLKPPNNPFSQLPHADSMGDDLRMLWFTRFTD